MGFLLLVISTILKFVFAPIAYTYGTIISLYKKEWNEYNKNLAIAKDQYGNALCSYLFNSLLIEKGGYKFGNVDETISSCIGKNQLNGTLSKLGKILDWILDKFQKDHAIKSIDSTETNNIK